MSVAGGVAEASFLVLATRAGFAASRPGGAVEVFGNSLSLRWASILLLALVALRVGSALHVAHLSSVIVADSVAHVRRLLSRAFLRATYSAQSADQAGRLQELLTTFAQRSAELVGGLTAAVSAGFSLLSLLVLAVVVDPSGALVVIIAVAALGAVLRPIRAAVRREGRRTAQAGMGFATSLSEVSQLGLELHVFGVQEELQRRVDELIDENARLSVRLGYLRGALPALYSGLAYVAIACAVGIAALSESSNISAIGATMLVLLRSLSYGQALQASSATIAASVPFAETLNHQLAYFVAEASPSGGLATDRITNLSLIDVSFSYVPGLPALVNVSLSFDHPGIYGVIGPSGGGKSTLVQLLSGLRAPTRGSMEVDGRSFHEYTRDCLADRIAMVPQDSRVIAGTIEENIRFFRQGISVDEVREAARQAHLLDDTAGRPLSLDARIGEGGLQISGGQQQRLCLARALVGRPDFLILDEPTSALDTRSENLVLETLASLSGETAVVVVTHRMAVLEICDQVVVVEHGHVAAHGTPQELTLSSAYYRSVVQPADRPS